MKAGPFTTGTGAGQLAHWEMLPAEVPRKDLQAGQQQVLAMGAGHVVQAALTLTAVDDTVLMWSAKLRNCDRVCCHHMVSVQPYIPLWHCHNGAVAGTTS